MSPSFVLRGVVCVSVLQVFLRFQDPETQPPTAMRPVTLQLPSFSNVYSSYSPGSQYSHLQDTRLRALTLSQPRPCQILSSTTRHFNPSSQLNPFSNRRCEPYFFVWVPVLMCSHKSEPMCSFNTSWRKAFSPVCVSPHSSSPPQARSLREDHGDNRPQAVSNLGPSDDIR